jgi:GTP-binding protein
MFTLAILGRPNVGKSTLFNRLTGTRFALVDDQPGVTRDRREGKGNIGPLTFTVLDTAGLEQARAGTLAARMTLQSEQALMEADVALLLVDGRAGLTAEDRHFANLARKSGKPVILGVNKCEGGKGRDTVAEAYGLGLGDPVPISAAHGEGLGELYEALAPFDKDLESRIEEQPKPSKRKKTAAAKAAAAGGFPEDEEEIVDDSPPPTMQIAIVGRPNAGKSTLFNRLLGFERTLTGPEAGITRDAIAVDFTYGGKALKLIDTAGMRKRGNVSEKLEKMAVEDSRRAVQYASVVVLVLDAETALEKQDLTLADHIEKEGRAVIVALNKWDKVENKQQYLQDAYERMESVMPQVGGVAVVPISAERGQHIDKLMDAVFAAYATWNRRIPTRKLNTWLEEALVRHSPPIMNGRRIKIRYITQIKTRPPTFALFASKADKMPDSYKRYLVGSLREVFDLPGVPIRLVIKSSKNPYV